MINEKYRGRCGNPVNEYEGCGTPDCEYENEEELCPSCEEPLNVYGDCPFCDGPRCI